MAPAAHRLADHTLAGGVVDAGSGGASMFGHCALPCANVEAESAQVRFPLSRAPSPPASRIRAGARPLARGSIR
eukprot:scaffold26104_cov122-Isochrysis_galbana.AAC.7